MYCLFLVADAVIWNDMKKLTAGSSWQNLESPLYGTAVPFGLQLEWLITAGSYQVVSLEVQQTHFVHTSGINGLDYVKSEKTDLVFCNI